MGVEVTGKTLGIIGCGNIGSIAAERALGLKMKVIAYDPFLSPGEGASISVWKRWSWIDLFARADFISLHTPLTEKTRNIIDARALEKMKPGVRIINCARGGLIVEEALKAALEAGHVAGAALDVFAEEPATDNALFGVPGVICTPHLGAATAEAQENVAVQVAEQMADYLLTGAITNADQFPLDQRGRGAEAQALRQARRTARLICRATHRIRAEEHPHRICRRDCRDEHPRLELGGAGRCPAADAAGGEHGLRAGDGEGTRHCA